jgi:hypothetical protein
MKYLLFWTQFDIKSVDRPLCKTLKQFSHIWFFLRIVGSSGFSGGKGTIWFSILYNGPLRKRTKSFGMLCRIMVRLSENVLSRTWKRSQTLFTKMSWNILTQFGMSKVLLWHVATFWSLGMLDLTWFPLGLRWFYQGDCILQLTFQFVPKKIQKTLEDFLKNISLWCGILKITQDFIEAVKFPYKYKKSKLIIERQKYCLRGKCTLHRTSNPKRSCPILEHMQHPIV